MTTPQEVVVVGADDPISTDVMESLSRLQIGVVAAVLSKSPTWELSPAPVVLHHDEVSPLLAKMPAVLGPHSPDARKRVQEYAKEAGFNNFPSIIDPTAIVAQSAKLDEGLFINAGAIVAGHATIESCALVNRGASLGHHSVLEKYAVLGPGAIVASNCRICAGAMLGAGAILRPNIIVGPGSIVGAGAVVTKNVDGNVIVAGNPARVMGAVQMKQE